MLILSSPVRCVCGSADGAELTLDTAHLSNPIRQALVEDVQSNLWASSSSSPSSSRRAQQLSQLAQAQSTFHASPPSQPSLLSQPSASASFLHCSSREADDELQQLQLQQAVDALSLQDNAAHNGSDGGVGHVGQLHSQATGHGLGKSSSSSLFAASPTALSEGGGSSDVSSSYLYNLNLQQSLLSSLNLSALSPGQLALLQQQMQRLSSLNVGVDEQQQKLQQQQQLQFLQLQQMQQQHQHQQQQHQHQQQQHHHSHHALLLQQQQLQLAQSTGYGRGGYGQSGGHRPYRGGGVSDERSMRGGYGGGGERYHSGRRGRDERGHGDRHFQQRSQTKYTNGKQGYQQHQAGGYRGADGRGAGYGGVYGQHELSGAEDKLLSPHRPLSPLPAAAHYSLSGDPSDDAFSSSLLTQFSSSSTLDELTGHIYAIAKDQYGCRLLQRMLDEQQPAGLCDLVFSECYEHINELMTDAFGNYLMQKLIEHCHESQRVAIIGRAAADLVAIALNMHGTRAVQKMVETVTTAKEVEVVIAALRSSVVTLIKDLNGNHVIQRCLHHLSSADNQFIYDAVSRHCVSVSTHKHGCCVLQRCIDYATAGQKRQLVQEVVNNALELVQDAFGNYVVQYVLDLGDAQVTGGVIQNLLGHISSLSVQKFSSNVVEKCLELASEKLRAKMIDELINAERLPRLLQDPYANYVLQKALTVSKRQQFERLVTAIKPHLLSLKNTSFGKRIQSKIVRKFPHLGLAQDVEELSAGGGADQGGHGPHGRSHQLGGGGHLGQGGQQQQHYSQQQSHPALLQSGVAVGSALRGYGAVSPSTALQQSMLQQQQLALQQLSHQHQLLQQGGGGVGSVGGGLGQSSGGVSFGGAVGVQGLSNPSANELAQLQSQPHSLHTGPPGLPQPVGNGSTSASHSLLNGMPQLLAYPPSTLHNSTSHGQPLTHNHRAGGMAVNHGLLPNYARPLM